MSFNFSDPKWNEVFSELQRTQIYELFINALKKQDRLDDLKIIFQPFESIPFEEVRVVLINPPKDLPKIDNCLAFRLIPKGLNIDLNFNELWRGVLQELVQIGCIVWLVQSQTKPYIRSLIEEETLTDLLNPQIDMTTNKYWYATMKYYLNQFDSIK